MHRYSSIFQKQSKTNFHHNRATVSLVLQLHLPAYSVSTAGRSQAAINPLIPAPVIMRDTGIIQEN